MPGISDASPAPGGAEAGGRAGAARDPWLDGFEQGGAWDTCPPGPVLSAVLARAAGPEWRCPEATDDELIGILRRLDATESWAAAGRLGVIRELIRRDGFPRADRTRHGDLPGEWSETVNREISLALGVTVLSAGRQSFLAWDLGARLPGIAALLEDGTLSLVKARIISEAFALLSDEDVTRAAAMLIAQLTGKAPKTPGQMAALAARIAAQVDPAMAERRRKAAEKVARVELFREGSGTAALSGRDLPPDAALSAMASVNARAEEYKDSGAFGDALMDQYRATAYVDLLSNVAAWERIAYGYLVSTGPAPGTDDACPAGSGHPDDDGDGDQDSPDSDNPGPGTPGPGAPDSGGPGSSGSRRDNAPDAWSAGGTGSRPSDGGGAPPADDHRTGHGPVGEDPADDPEPVGGSGGGLPASSGPLPQRSSLFQRPPPGPPGYQPRLTDLVLPLATLQGNAGHPGESHGFGTLDPDLCRRLAALAIRSIHTAFCVTVTDQDGTAIGHGCLRLAGHTGGPPDIRPRKPAGPASLAALPARVILTITAGRLDALLSLTSGLSGASGPLEAPGGEPYGWVITPGAPDAVGSRDSRGRPPPGDPDWCRVWTIRLPGGVESTVRVEPVLTHSCDHRYESHGYQPNATLRHLVQVRDRTCTFPTCSRHARESDFEHAVPYDRGGRTCTCNAGARSRSCHRVKQSKGWIVTQPGPGRHQWRAPSGRTYTQASYQYPV